VKIRCKVGSASAERRTETGRKMVAEELLRRCEAEGEEFLNRIFAIDETWIRDFEPQLKSQSAQWKHATSPRPKKMSPPTIAN
jgi:hypothetical protein